MSTYSYLRTFADSWFLIGMFGFFIAVVLLVYLPSRRATNDNIARIPLRNGTPSCSEDCANCECKFESLEESSDG